ncbi:unnamed protein product [Danaus chrysippus]|uniref:(African queen) hypothetical protein n=1 Tax=Danaus chrysippus TaxID=151541 RepID=A0A8J2QR76_9NEOP|nr:unnamed protein product [Danaus chrysippus]
MENSCEPSNDKRSLVKAKSVNSGCTKQMRSEPVKRKSFNVNEAVRSLDLALVRLKKSKLVNGDIVPNSTNLGRKDPMEHITNQTNFTDNSSVVSLNFSQYELMRNLSRSNCNLDNAFSNTTCETFSSLTDIPARDEQLERYFRSIDVWSRNHRDASSSEM